MDWLTSFIGGDEPNLTNIALLVVGLLIALFIIIWLFRKIFGAATNRVTRNRQPRLSVTDAAVVDDKRRLVLVRRDAVEHLVMIGGPTDIVIEQNIVRAAPAEVPRQAPATPATAPAAPSPKPAPAANNGAVKESGVAAGTGAAAGAATSTAVSEPAPAPVMEAPTLSTVSAELPQVETASITPPERNTSDLADDLEHALTGETRSGDVPEVSNGDKPASKTEDEMQRLLDELSSSGNKA